MIPSKSNKSESRRSSILKSHKPRQPLQDANINSSCSENTPSKNKKRRVSFAEKKHIKEFCHSTEQGTVWDNTYEEHDFSLKGSFIDQDIKTESKKNVSNCTTENDCTYTAVQICQNDTNNSNVTADQPCLPDTETYENNSDEDCDLDLANVDDNNEHCSLDLTNVDEFKEFDEESCRQPGLSNTFAHASKNAISSNIIVYRDTEDTEDCANNIKDNTHAESHADNVNSELDKMCVQNLSMELTAAISLPFLPSICFNMEENKQKNIQVNNDVLHKDNFCTDYTSNNNDMSMEITEIVPTSHKSTDDLKFSKQIPIGTLYCENTERNTVSSTDDNIVIFSKNSQRNKNTVYEETQNTNCNDISMELTTAVQSFITGTDACNRNDMRNDIVFNTSMEITAAVSCETYEKNTHDLKQNREISESTNKIDLNNLSMETRPVNILPMNVYDKENLRVDELINVSTTNKTIFFHNESMKMTEVISKSRQEISDSNNCKLLFKENTGEEKDMKKSVSSTERTGLLRKSKDFTEAVSVPLHQERTTFNNTAEALFTQATPREFQSFKENSAKSVLQTDAVDKTFHDLSMEITTAVSSILPISQNVNETENLITSKNNTFQCLTTNITDSNCVIESEKNITKENFTSSRGTMETTNVHDELLNTRITLTLTDNSDHLLSSSLGNVTNRKKSFKNGNTDTRKICNSLVESQSCKENNIHLFPSIDNYVDDVYNSTGVDGLTNNTMDTSMNLLIQRSESNSGNNLNETDDCSFLRKSLPYLDNSFTELQSINPPSFVSMNSEESLLDTLCGDKPKTFTSTDAALDNKNSNPNQLEPINVEYEQMEDSYRSIIGNKINNLKTNCQEVTKIIINDNQINESSCYMTDKQDFNGESITSFSNVNQGKTSTISNTNHLKEIKVTNEDQVDKECTREKINDNAKVQNVQEKEQYSHVEKTKEIDRLDDHLKQAEAIEDRIDQEEYREENLNSEMNQQNMVQKEECAVIKDKLESEKNLTQENLISTIIDEILIDQDPFLLLLQRLGTYAKSDDCIWNVRHKNTDRKMIVFGFIANSLLIVIFLSDDFSHSEEDSIKQIKVVSLLSDDADAPMKIVHGLIMEKINAEVLINLYRTQEDILSLLDFVAQDVKLAMDFMFDLKRLKCLHLMEIKRDEISFVSRSKQLDIILKITVNVKRFDELTPNDINVECLLGKIKETEVKNLIKGVKKDHKFLRRFMNDVKEYIDIMEFLNNSPGRK